MKQSTFSKIATIISGLLMITGLFFSCSKDDDDAGSSNTGSSSGSKYKGTWVRVVAASGDETDLAIGTISGESEDRVYMCEWKGAVGLYKGKISGSTITWDATYGLPDAAVGLEGGQLTLVYPSVANSLKTYYNSGSWSSKCGPLSSSNTGGGSGGSGSGSGGSGTGQAMFWTASDHGCGPITVSINGTNSTITNYYSSSPACGASGCATFTLNPGKYSFSASCGSYTWGNSDVTVTANSCFKMQLN